MLGDNGTDLLTALLSVQSNDTKDIITYVRSRSGKINLIIIPYSTGIAINREGYTKRHKRRGLYRCTIYQYLFTRMPPWELGTLYTD